MQHLVLVVMLVVVTTIQAADDHAQDMESLLATNDYKGVVTIARSTMITTGKLTAAERAAFLKAADGLAAQLKDGAKGDAANIKTADSVLNFCQSVAYMNRAEDIDLATCNVVAVQFSLVLAELSETDEDKQAAEQQAEDDAVGVARAVNKLKMKAKTLKDFNEIKALESKLNTLMAPLRNDEDMPSF